MTYRLGVDLGTTFTAAAIATGDHTPTIVDLGDHSAEIPSVLHIRPDGQYVIGEAALRRGIEEPEGLVREVKRRIGDPVALQVAGRAYKAQDLTARLLRSVLAAVNQRMGGAPEYVTLTHPANWGSYKLQTFAEVADLAEVENVRFTSEPVSAAAQYSSHAALGIGDRLAIYDLGGGTFDVCVLEKTDTGFGLLGTPDGLENLGGVDFDQAVFEHVWNACGAERAGIDIDSPAVTAALTRLRRDCVDLKEALSADTHASVAVNLPGLSTMVRMTRREFEAVVREPINATISATVRALDSAHLTASALQSVVLVGGSSRIPLVSEMLQHELGVPVALDLHPKHVVPLGAARLTGGESAASQQPTATTASAGAAPTMPPPPRIRAAARTNPTSAPQDPVPERDSDSTDAGLKRARFAWPIAAAVVVMAVVLIVLALVTLRSRPDTRSTTGQSTVSPSASTPPITTAAVAQPLSGGEYTWANGTSMTVSISFVEQFGVTFPFCPDWSCGTAASGDIRVVLKYSVKAPHDLVATTRPDTCPGTLRAATSGRGDAPTEIQNMYAKELTSPIQPGKSATGRVEYAINRDARDESFMMQSTCGDQTGNEVATFEGKLPEPHKAKAPLDVGDPAIRRRYLDLRVDQVRTDVGKDRYATLVETCTHKHLPEGYRTSNSLKPSWTLLTSTGTKSPIEEWTTLRPTFPYGDYGPKHCMSGWLAFKVADPKTVEAIQYTDRLGQWTVWHVVEPSAPPSRSPTTNNSPTTSPTKRPPTRRPTTAPSRTKPPSQKPSQPPQTPEPSDSYS